MSAAPVPQETPGESSTAPAPIEPISVKYCEECSYPIEYCEFGSSFTRCKESLKEEDPDLYEKLYSEDALQARMGTLSVEGQARIEQDAVKREAKAAAKAEAAEKKKKAAKVLVKRIERQKRKYVTHVVGLEVFGIDLKKAAKQFATKFATGSSVKANAAGEDEIVVQGDVADDIFDMIVEEVGVLKGIPEDNIEIIEEKKKKGE